MKRRYFTLMELMVSIGIIMVLAAMTYGGITYASHRAQEAKTVATMEMFISALETFRQDYGFYPIVDKSDAKEVDLSDNAWKLFMNEETKPNKKNRAYMETELEKLTDAWGQPFYYQYPGKNNTAKYDLWSKGPDKQHGKKGASGSSANPASKAGENESDDICSWKQR